MNDRGILDDERTKAGGVGDSLARVLGYVEDLAGTSATASICHDESLGERSATDEPPAATITPGGSRAESVLSSAETLPTSSGPLLGARYQVMRPHAEGGLGIVSVARDVELNREVALKEIKPHNARDADSRARFVLEAEITGCLEHPGIVPVYGMGQFADGRPFYAMRLIRGESLKSAGERFHAARGPRDRYESVEFREQLSRMVAVCLAIEYAHSRGVLHRDLKPDNIMLGRYGETLVVDWGLAKSQGRLDSYLCAGEATLAPRSARDSAATQMGSAVGTPIYMSPEQACGKLDEIGPCSDVYSLGATLYFVLTGTKPFNGTVGSVLEAVKAGHFVKPRFVQPSIPPALEAICLKAMALKPADRYPSAAALAQDIERYLADEPVIARRETYLEWLKRLARRNRTLLLGTLLALTFGLSLLVAALAVTSHANERAHHAMQRIDELQEEIQLLETHLVGSEDKLMRERALERLRTMHQKIDEHFDSVPFFEKD